MQRLLENRLSRLDSDRFPRDLRSATEYWLEHRTNFNEMLQKLMQAATLYKLATNTKALCLQLNIKAGWVADREYNDNVIKRAYEQIELEMQRSNKKLIYDLFDGYFSIMASRLAIVTMNVASTMVETITNLIHIYDVSEPETFDAALRPINEKLLGANYDITRCRRYFYPQLMPFVLRFLDIYDSSLEGFHMSDYLVLLQNKVQMERARHLMEMHEAKVFGSKHYWQERYSDLTVHSDVYDWYQDYNMLSELVHRYLREHAEKTGKIVRMPQATAMADSGENTDTQNVVAEEKPAPPPEKYSIRILNVGCGNSPMAEMLYQEGFANVVSIDYCEKVVEVMKARAQRKGMHDLAYLALDATEMAAKFPPEMLPFDAAIDKGTLDAISTNEHGDTMCERVCEEIDKCLAPGGLVIVISCNPERLRTVPYERLQWTVEDSQRFEARSTRVFSNSAVFVFLLRKNDSGVKSQQ